MNEMLYEMIFKRKSFHIFRDVYGVITNEEIDLIDNFFAKIKLLVDGIKTEMRIAPCQKQPVSVARNTAFSFTVKRRIIICRI